MLRYTKLKCTLFSAVTAASVLLSGCSDVRENRSYADPIGFSDHSVGNSDVQGGIFENSDENSGNLGENSENSGENSGNLGENSYNSGENSQAPDGNSTTPSDTVSSTSSSGNSSKPNGNSQSSSNSNGNSQSSGNSNSNSQSNKPSGNSSSSSKPSGNGLTSEGNGSEGVKTTGKFNYGEALQKSILFYELQRSGDIDEKTARSNWRGDSGMSDGADVGLDLTGGLYDAGDNVKFNLPMAYTASMLAWSVYEDKDAYQKSGQLDYALGNIKWICDYLIKCHPSDNVYYYQVGDGNADHSWWGAAEVMQMNRPAYKVDKNSPGSTVVAEAAAALAACSAVYKSIDKSYSDKCLSHAKSLYNFAESTKSDAGYTAANGFYTSWSGFYDELAWAAMWLNIATGDSSYINKAKQYEKQCDGNYKWTLCWDDKYIGAVCLLAEVTGEQTYKTKLEKSLDWWCGTGGESVTYSPKGLAWLDSWGSLRYATTAAFVAASYADSGKCPSSKVKKYRDFCAKQVDYALGSTGRSFVVGFGVNPPEHPHHRTAQGSWSDNMNEPNYHRHTLYGALVGGPDASDSYTDSVSDYNKNEVACDYNAGFTGALAKMYKQYGGETLKNFGAVEKVGEELYVEHRINATGNGFTEIKALIYNKSAWPARVTDNLELRYFVDLSELSDPSSVTVSTNYSEGAKYGGLYEWNKAKNIYYVSIDFSGVKIYPGGQSAYKKEVQFRMSANGWDPDNDPSFKELKGTNGSELVRAVSVGLYEGGTLVFGSEPDGKSAGLVKPSGSGSVSSSKPASSSSTSQQHQQSSSVNPTNPSGAKDGLKVTLNQQQTSGSGNSIGFAIELYNGTGADIDLSALEIGYFFTADGKNDLKFWCDYACVSGSNYSAITSDVKADFVSAKGNKSDTKCAIKFSGGKLAAGDTLNVQGRITAGDWSSFDLGNDYSAGNANNLYITKNGTAIFGSKP